MSKLKILFFCYIFTLIGVNVFSQEWQSIGPYGGDFNCIEIADYFDNVIYVGTYYGGLYRTVNWGENWVYLGFSGDKIISSIAIDPNNCNIVYFSWYSSGSSSSSGVMKSEDGGFSWRDLSISARIIASPHTLSDIIFVGNGNGLLKSVDGGNNFMRIEYNFGYNNFRVISFDPKDTSIMYVGTREAIYKSSDFGKSWVFLREFIDEFHIADISSISVSPLNNSLLVGTLYEGMFISIDGGISWRVYDIGLNIRSVFCDHVDMNTIYIGGVGGFEKSTDLGYNWTEMIDGYFTGGDKCKNNIYLLDYRNGKICRSTDNGQTWENKTDGIKNVFIDSLLPLNDGPDLLAIITSGYTRELLKYDNDLWSSNEFSSNYGICSELFYNDHRQEIYMVNPFFLVSVDHGATWNSRMDGFPYCSPTDMAINGDTLYIATVPAFEGREAGVYMSTNAGGHWYSASYGLPASSYINATIPIFSVAIDRNNRSNIYAGGHEGFFCSTNSGDNWSQRYVFPNMDVIDIAIDSDNSNIIYLIAGDYNYLWHSEEIKNAVYKSTDSGFTFQYLDCELDNVNCLFDDHVDNVLLGGGRNGVIASYDKGDHWAKIGGNLDSATVNCITKIMGSDRIYVGTKERGVYLIDYDTDVAIVRDSKPFNFFLDQNYPNPFNPETTIRFQVNEKGHLKLEVLDLHGRHVSTVLDEYYPAGQHEVTIDGRDWPSGIYLYRLQAGGFTDVKKMVLMK